MLLKIALRNLLRHKRRTFFSAITIAVGMLFFIAMDSIMAGMDRGAIDNMVALRTAAIRLQTRQYAEEQDALPLKYGIDNFESIRSNLLKDKRIKGVTGRTRFIGQMSIYTDMKPIIGTVIEPATDSTVFSLRDYIEGAYFSEGNEREILLGKDLAEELGLNVGDYVTLYAMTRYDSHNADDFKIIGVVATTDPVINGSGVFISQAGGDSFLDLEGLRTDVMVGVHRKVNLRDFLKEIRAVQSTIHTAYPDLIAQNVLEQEAGFFEIAKSKRGFGMVFLAVILLIAGVGIFNTVLMSVYERIREIGVLRAFGLRQGEMTRLFLIEGAATGIFGVALGLALGTVVNVLLVKYGYPLDKLAGDAMGDFPIWGTIYGEWNFGVWLAVSFFAIVVATIAGYIPARKAGSMEIISTLRFF
jgi:ABC-type lipoprotein release transport system permease subunit